ncbi:MAG: META domain-containing protein [Ignavibacteriae bacterium]|nr:META domain-containing protein [Ignavibacteriota bacterium]MCB9214872.1 META domain-containing protein [Ignavibacteria bacterium]
MKTRTDSKVRIRRAGRRIFLPLLIFPLLLSLQACKESSLYPYKSDKGEKGITIEDVYGVEWRLEAFEEWEGDQVGQSNIPPAEQVYTLTFQKDGGSGTNHCNLYGVEYKTDGVDGISFNSFISTKVYCGDESLDQTFSDAILNAERYQIGESTLRIFYEGNRRALFFKKVVAEPITLMPLELVNFAPSVPFSTSQPQINGDLLTVQVQYSGGCEEHKFSLVGPETIPSGDPTPITLYLQHSSKPDPCLAYISNDLTFDLTPLKERWKQVTGKSSGEILITLNDLHGGSVTGLSWKIN